MAARRDNARHNQRHRPVGAYEKKDAVGEDLGTLLPMPNRSDPEADRRAAGKTPAQFAMAKAWFEEVIADEFFMDDERLRDMCRAGMTPRDIYIVEQFARGKSSKSIGEAIGMKDTTHVLDKFREAVDIRRMQHQLAFMPLAAKVLKAQGEVGCDKMHDQFAAAGKNLLDVLHPRKSGRREVNIAGGDIVKGNQVNAEVKVAIATYSGLSDDELDAELKRVEAVFRRDEAPFPKADQDLDEPSS